MKDKDDYKQYLQSREWKNKRLQKATLVNFICELCGKTEKIGYEIHHKTYKNLKNEKMSELMFLCKDCHKIFHQISKEDRLKLQNNLNGEIKKEKRKRECINCKYSDIVTYKSKNRHNVLYCQKHLITCQGVCKQHVFGTEKNVIQKQRPKKNKKSKNSDNQLNGKY